MSHPKVEIGSSVEGVMKGNIEMKSTYNVAIGSSHSYKVGGKAVGTVEEQAEIKFDEKIDTTMATQENTDQCTESSSPAESSEVAKYQLNDDIRPIGSKVIVKPKNDGFQIKGRVTIFNQEFRNTGRFRNGSAHDVERLIKTFQRFGIEAAVNADFNLREIVKETYALSKMDFSAYKLFVMVYMSHGHNNGMVSAADKEFNLKDVIINPIMRNKSLHGVPKIFITVACRGSNDYSAIDGEENDGHIVSEETGIDYSNCIISYSTYKGYVSKRTWSGTYFIKHLCDNINADNGEIKIHSIFAKVNGELAEMSKQVPIFKTTMGDISFRDLSTKE